MTLLVLGEPKEESSHSGIKFSISFKIQAPDGYVTGEILVADASKKDALMIAKQNLRALLKGALADMDRQEF